MLADLFEPKYISEGDTTTHHICGACGQLKPLSDFYKDGTTRSGQTKYRRDCKECYKQTRVYEARMKTRKGASSK